MRIKVDTSIQISGLKTGVYEYDYHLGESFFEPYENEELKECEADFHVKLEKKERLMVFSFSFKGQTRLECDRCLEKIIVPLCGEQTLYVKFGEQQASDDENVFFLAEDESKIDLAQWMYEFVAVAVPMVHVHPDDEDGKPTCNPEMLKYINDATPSDQEPDPRWAALTKLKDENKQNKNK